VATAEMHVLGICERKIVRTIYGVVTEGERGRIRTTKDIKDTLQGEDIVKFIKSLPLR
jgi:hypothetical protein